MTGSVLSRARSFLIRSLAVLAVIMTYAVTTVGTHVASVIGVSSLALVTTTKPAEAQWWRRRYRRPFFRRRWWGRRRW
jgi:hypothetical protein